MPLYEYICEADGEVLELLRPSSQADEPVDDPKGKGRVFTRQHSTFAAGGGAAVGGQSLLGRSTGSAGGCCPCGKPHGSCSA